MVKDNKVPHIFHGVFDQKKSKEKNICSLGERGNNVRLGRKPLVTKAVNITHIRVCK
jgi:hypothetical protein